MQLNLGILGYNSELSIKGLKQLAENNHEQVLRFDYGANRLLLKDGTQIKAIMHVMPVDYQLRGMYLDQLILFDDDRWLISWDKADIIHEIIKELDIRSRVPEEFQIIRYEDVR